MENGEQGGYFVKLVVLQCVLTLIIISSVVVIKYFFKGTYNELKQWYEINVRADTDVYEVIGELDEI